MTDQELIDKIMDWFDFEQVHKVMTALDWKWGGDRAVPTIPKLRKQARELMKMALIGLSNNFEEKSYSAATGGFEATAFQDKDNSRILDLKFVVSEWTAGLET
jgi:hypothetical protein